MCKLLVGIQLKENSKLFKTIFDVQFPEVAELPHGLAGTVIEKDNKITVSRELDNYSKVYSEIADKLVTSKLIGLHGRQSTSGDISKTNVHFFKSGDLLMAHNGIIVGEKIKATSRWDFPKKEEWENMTKKQQKKISKKANREVDLYMEQREEIEETEDTILRCTECTTSWTCGRHMTVGLRMERLKKAHTSYEVTEYPSECDSLQFLKSLPKKVLNVRVLSDHMKDRQFRGVGIIIDTKREKGFLFGTRAIEIQTDFKNYLFFYSYKPVKEIEYSKSLLGFNIPTGEDSAEIPTEELKEGVYEFSYKEKIQVLNSLVNV